MNFYEKGNVRKIEKTEKITIITADTYTEEFHKIIFCNSECNNFKIWELCRKICRAYNIE